MGGKLWGEVYLRITQLGSSSILILYMQLFKICVPDPQALLEESLVSRETMKLDTLYSSQIIQCCI